MIPRSIRSILRRALKAYGGADGTRALQWLSAQPNDEPTPRELDIIRLVTKGMSNKEVAAELDGSATTVRTHLAHIYDKLGVRNRTELTLWAIRYGLVVLSYDEEDDE